MIPIFMLILLRKMDLIAVKFQCSATEIRQCYQRGQTTVTLGLLFSPIGYVYAWKFNCFRKIKT